MPHSGPVSQHHTDAAAWMGCVGWVLKAQKQNKTNLKKKEPREVFSNTTIEHVNTAVTPVVGCASCATK